MVPPEGRTLTRTQDFMVVPSEVVYGPGGEKINKGIAYTALDGRMSSSFKIPISSSYQEEAEARRLKREKAMMKSKMARPDAVRSSNVTGTNGGLRSGRSRGDSRMGLLKGSATGSARPLLITQNSASSGSSKRKLLGERGSGGGERSGGGGGGGDRDSEKERKASTSSAVASGASSQLSSPRSLLSGGTSQQFKFIPTNETLSVRTGGERTVSGIGAAVSQRQSCRKESLNSVASVDSVSVHSIGYRC